VQFDPAGGLGSDADVVAVGETDQPPFVVDPAEHDPLAAG
jgi:hypothetical protein